MIEKQKTEKLYTQSLQKQEDEVRLRIDFEIKINKMHNFNMNLMNHHTTQEEKINGLNKELEKCRVQID